MKVFISKYALSSGIQVAEGEFYKNTQSQEDGTFHVKTIDGKPVKALYLLKKDWHADRESAVKEAYQMRLDRIASLKKQIAKLEKMEF